MKHDIDKTGKLMVYAAWILAAVLLTWLFSGIIDYQHNPNTDPETLSENGKSRTVILKRNRFGHYVANGRINGQPVEFLLDTGATHVSVPAVVARELGLERGARRNVQTANGIISTFSTTLDSVKLGEIELRNVRASINPHSQGRSVLLGMSYLKNLELVQRGDSLTIMQP